MDTLFAMVANDVGGIPPGRTAKKMRRMCSYQPVSSPAPCATYIEGSVIQDASSARMQLHSMPDTESTDVLRGPRILTTRDQGANMKARPAEKVRWGMGWISKDVRIYPSVPYKDGFREIVLKEDYEKVLAEKDREIVKWSELIGSFTRSQHRYLVEMERLKQALAEKDQELQQIREHEFQRGYQEAQEKYQQILEKAVKFAEAFEIIAWEVS